MNGEPVRWVHIGLLMLSCSVFALMGCSRESAQTDLADGPAKMASVPGNIQSNAASVTNVGTQEESSSGEGNPEDTVDWLQMRQFWNAAIALQGIDTGPENSTKHMLVFFDPDCHVCARQWSALKPYMDKVRIHWIPVATIDKESLRRAAAILASPDPAQALAWNEDHYDFTVQTGGYPIPSTAAGWALSVVQANTRSVAFTKHGAMTPTLGLELYNGKRYFRYPGMVEAKDMWIIVEELGNTMNPYTRTQESLKARTNQS